MHYIYSHSYLCWGSNKAFDFYQTQAIRNSDFKKKISTACYPKGYTESKLQAELKSPCSNGQALVNEYPFVIKDSEWVENQSHTFNGDSNDDLCKTEVAFIVPRTQCAYSSCGFDAAYQPPNENIPFIVSQFNKKQKQNSSR
jgi:GDA1/CD39 (nucleoside phosphatase) family